MYAAISAMLAYCCRSVQGHFEVASDYPNTITDLLCSNTSKKKAMSLPEIMRIESSVQCSAPASKEVSHFMSMKQCQPTYNPRCPCSTHQKNSRIEKQRLCTAYLRSPIATSNLRSGRATLTSRYTLASSTLLRLKPGQRK